MVDTGMAFWQTGMGCHIAPMNDKLIHFLERSDMFIRIEIYKSQTRDTEGNVIPDLVHRIDLNKNLHKLTPYMVFLIILGLFN